MVDNSILVPAGTYVLGDPCYTIEGDDWEYVIDITNFFQDENSGRLLDGRFFMAFGTAFGDGVFTGSNGIEYGVDAGLIGLVQVPDDYTTDRDDISIITFYHDTYCSNDYGRMNFGNQVYIDTDPPVEEDEEFDADYYWREENEDES